MKFSLSYSNKKENYRNVLFPQFCEVETPQQLAQVCRFDHVGALLNDGRRSNANFRSSDVVIMDCDNEDDNPETWVTPERVAEDLPSVQFAVVPSRHNMVPKGDKAARPKFHVYFPINECTDRERYVGMKEAILLRCPYFDHNAKDAARMIFGVENPEVTIFNDGEDSITVDEYINNNPLPPVPESSYVATTEALPQTHIEGWVIPEGKRNSTVFQVTLHSLVRYGDTEEAYRRINAALEVCQPPLDESEANSILESAKGYYEKIEKSDGYIPPDVYNRLRGEYEPEDYTDLGQARVFARVFGNILRFSPETDYMVYNGVFWEASEIEARRFVQILTDLQKQDADFLYGYWKTKLENLGIGALLNGVANESKIVGTLNDRQKIAYRQYVRAAKYKAFVSKRRNTGSITAILKEAAPLLTIGIENFDSQTYLLNTPDGTYDLCEGVDKVYPHKSEDYITKVTKVSPSDEGMDIWEDMLNTVFCGNEDLIRYVQQIVGLAVIGGVFAENIIIAYGDGRNGKSTFWNAIASCLGSYTGSLSADVLTFSCRRNIKPELAELRGKRLVIAAELEEGNSLNTAVLKQLCSTDPIYAEPKYHRPFSFIPTHLSVLYTNHLPKIGTTDTGTWRRIKVIPFNAVIQGNSEVKNYAKFLVENAGGAILKWAIEGAYIVINNGYKIDIPREVQNAIDEYRSNNNDFEDFLNDYCEKGNGLSVPSGMLYKAYREYSSSQGVFPKNKQDFYSNLDRAGFARRRKSKGVEVMGLKLKNNFTPGILNLPEGLEGMEATRV